MPWNLLLLICAIYAGVAVIVWIAVRAVRRGISRTIQEFDDLRKQRDYDRIEEEHALRLREQQALLRELLALVEEVRQVMQALKDLDSEDALSRPKYRLELVHRDLRSRVTSS